MEYYLPHPSGNFFFVPLSLPDSSCTDKFGIDKISSPILVSMAKKGFSSLEIYSEAPKELPNRRLLEPGREPCERGENGNSNWNRNYPYLRSISNTLFGPFGACRLWTFASLIPSAPDINLVSLRDRAFVSKNTTYSKLIVR